MTDDETRELAKKADFPLIRPAGLITAIGERSQIIGLKKFAELVIQQYIEKNDKIQKAQLV